MAKIHEMICPVLRGIKYPEGTKLYTESAVCSRDGLSEVRDLPLYTVVPKRYGIADNQKLPEVHAFITANKKIAVMIGADADNADSNQLSGRFFGAAMSQYHKAYDEVLQVGDRVLFIQVIPNVLSKPFMMYLADTLNKAIIPSEIKRECKYALYWADQANLEGTAGKPMGDLIKEHLEWVLNNL